MNTVVIDKHNGKVMNLNINEKVFFDDDIFNDDKLKDVILNTLHYGKIIHDNSTEKDGHYYRTTVFLVDTLSLLQIK